MDRYFGFTLRSRSLIIVGLHFILATLAMAHFLHGDPDESIMIALIFIAMTSIRAFCAIWKVNLFFYSIQLTIRHFQISFKFTAPKERCIVVHRLDIYRHYSTGVFIYLQHF